MTNKGTWFLPPDLTYLPTGELSLGTVITHPSRPTLALAAPTPELKYNGVPLPCVVSLPETDHTHSRGSGSSTGLSLFANLIDLVSATFKVDTSRYKTKVLTSAVHEVRVFDQALSDEVLKEILSLEKVKRHMDRGRRRWGRAGNVYIISGLRVATGGVQVTESFGRTTEVGLEASAPVPAGPVPLEVGAGVSGGRERNREDGYKTAPGVVFAFRVHVIREKRDGGAEAEVFSHRAAFMSGEGEEEGGKEMECMCDIGTEVLDEDLQVEREYEEYTVGQDKFALFVPG